MIENEMLKPGRCLVCSRELKNPLLDGICYACIEQIDVDNFLNCIDKIDKILTPPRREGEDAN